MRIHVAQLCLATLVLSSCESPFPEPRLRLFVDRAEYQSGPIVASVRNDGDAPARLPGCMGPEKLHVGWEMDSYRDGAWLSREAPFFQCSPAEMGRIELPASGEYLDSLGRGIQTLLDTLALGDTLQLGLMPGQYRLRVWYEQPGHEGRFLRSEPSAPFRVQ